MGQVVVSGHARPVTKASGPFENGVARSRAGLMILTGSPGVGKTRLSREFCLGVTEATVIEMRCRRSGTATFAPIAEERGVDLEVTGDPVVVRSDPEALQLEVRLVELALLLLGDGLRLLARLAFAFQALL